MWGVCWHSSVPTVPVETFVCVKLYQLASNLTTPQTARLCGSVAVMLHYDRRGFLSLAAIKSIQYFTFGLRGLEVESFDSVATV